MPSYTLVDIWYTASIPCAHPPERGHTMPPKQRTTRPQTKKRTPKAKTTGPKAKASAPKARTRRQPVAPAAPPDPEQDAPGAAPPDLALILPAEDLTLLDQGPPEAPDGGPTGPQAADIAEVHFTA